MSKWIAPRYEIMNSRRFKRMILALKGTFLGKRKKCMKNDQNKLVTTINFP